MKHKHQWVTVGSTWNRDGKRIKVKKRCRDPNCGAEKVEKSGEE